MKQALRKIVPILLVILIIASMAWYCFVYDRDFTRDMLLKQARFHSVSGSPELASWFYDLAYKHSGQDEIVAIELANQFKAVGNYTKAEYTLSNAIADGGSVELYIALCKTYVQQDKLLDAVNMLNNVSDPVIKSQLDLLRPAAPVAAPEPGFYSEYISVSFENTDHNLYISMDGEYPSTGKNPYSEPIPLEIGETTIQAVAVSKSGLVSPLAVFGYTVGGIIEEVVFEDFSVEQAIRETLGAEADEPLYTSDLWTITEFTAPAGASSYADISRMSYLETLNVEGQSFDSLSFLSGLNRLDKLNLVDCKFPSEDLNIIASLPALSSLTLSECSLSTVAGLEKAQGVTYLDLSSNSIRNIDPLASMIHLKEIHLQNNALTGLTALSGLTELEKLDVSYNSLTSVSSIASCVKLSWLSAGNNSLTALTAVNNLPALTYLAVPNNSLTDVSILSACTGLKELSIASNSLTDISALSTLVNLEIFDFSYNEISQLPQWGEGCPMRIIDGSYNALASISSLSTMDSLTYVYMDYNQISTIADLAGCPNLVMVNVYGNNVDAEDVSALTEHSIIVNYDPT
ncbi:MAG: leucine-rich repeat domain-containing protein [Oscillospiraceae bacterium]|nr:leucine-rich repeat domain-containing protein [Oscillospiraceae bacterium]